SDFNTGTALLLGNGDGTFGPPTQIQPRNGPALAVTDLGADGKLDVVNTFYSINDLSYSLGNGDGTFQPVEDLGVGSVGPAPVAVAVADFGSALPPGVLGPPDGHPDIIVVDSGLSVSANVGPPAVILLPGLVDKQGQFAGFGDPPDPIPLASPRGPLDVK